MAYHAEVDRWLAAHHEVITLRRARILGLTDGEIRGRVRRGEWRNVHPGVFVRAASRSTPEQHLLAAVAWGGAGSMCVGTSALWLWGLLPRCSVPPRPIHVGVPSYRGRPPAGIRTSRLAQVPRSIVRRQVPTLDLPHALASAATVLGEAELRGVLDRAVADHPGIAADTLLQLDPGGALAGRRGAKVLRRALLTGGYTGTKQSSAGESPMVRLAAAAGIPKPRREYPVVVEGELFKLDCANPEAYFTYEFDGYADHHTPAQHRRDNRRRRLLQRAGWTVRVYTWTEVTQEPERVARELYDDYHAALAAQGRRQAS